MESTEQEEEGFYEEEEFCSAEMGELYARAAAGDEEVAKHPRVADAYDEDGWTPLHTLAEKGILAALWHPYVTEVSDEYLGITPLHSFAQSRNAKAVLEHPRVATTHDLGEDTPLHYLARGGYVAALRHPLVGVVHNYDGETPLHCLVAARSRWDEANAAELIRAHPDVSRVKNIQGKTPLDLLEESLAKRSTT